jgi:uncharacterized protein YcfJ
MSMYQRFPCKRSAALLGVALSGLPALATLDATAASVEMATVVSSMPVTVSVSVPRSVCRDETRLVPQEPSGAGAVIGAIAGAALGNSVGGGFGRAAATGIGLVAGAAVGDQVEANGAPLAQVPVRRCQTVSRLESRTVGYDVVYDHAGQRYSTRMDRDPGTRFAVDVRPAERSGEALPVPTEPGAQLAADDSGSVNNIYGSSTSARPATVLTPLRIYPDSTAAATLRTIDTAPSTIYYEPAPAYYYAPPLVTISPFIGFGFGYYGGHHRGYDRGYYRGGGRHWR